VKGTTLSGGSNPNERDCFTDGGWPKNHQKLKCEPLVKKERRARGKEASGESNTQQQHQQKQQKFRYQRKRRKRKESEDDEMFLVSYKDDPIKVSLIMNMAFRIVLSCHSNTYLTSPHNIGLCFSPF